MYCLSVGVIKQLSSSGCLSLLLLLFDDRETAQIRLDLIKGLVSLALFVVADKANRMLANDRRATSKSFVAAPLAPLPQPFEVFSLSLITSTRSSIGQRLISLIVLIRARKVTVGGVVPVALSVARSWR